MNWNWISENGIWILLAIGPLFLLRRAHGHGGLGGLLGGHGHHGGHRDHGEREASRADQPQAETAIDPVSGNTVRIEGALTSVLWGRIYYFKSRENRALFESSPDRYVGTVSGEALGSEHAAGHRPHRRHGC
ncbi:hypothetical protein [Aromatoleum evansii]|uniref:hypothetical protein n=1 Tax=Aromatoleum evansii TaxID=59406 RepID=UPI00145EBF2C|nr:hypothetical protein [Aromatoleum evansii]NMG29970.1 hypothetical protein [Aromatoleum evansii]